MTVTTRAGAATVLIDLEYSSDVALKNSSDQDLTLTFEKEDTLSNGVSYKEYSVNENLNDVNNLYGNWSQLDLGDHVIIDPEFQFISGAAGDQAVVLMDGDRFYVVYPFDVEVNPEETRAISTKAKRLVIDRFESGKTYLRRYNPVGDLATGSVRVLLDSYVEIPSYKQLNEATVKVEKASLPLKTVLSSEPVRYDRTGFGCSLTLSLADTEVELLSYIFGVYLETSENHINEGDDIETYRKRLRLKDGSVNSTQLNGRRVILMPEPIPEISDPNYLEWLNSVVTFPRGVIADPDQQLAYSPQRQRSYQATIQCTPDENGNRLIFGNEGL